MKMLLIMLMLLMPQIVDAKCWLEKNPDFPNTYLICFIDKGEIYCDVYEQLLDEVEKYGRIKKVVICDSKPKRED